MTRQRTLISTIMFFTLTLCVGLGHAQQAPDGNAHPETRDMI